MTTEGAVIEPNPLKELPWYVPCLLSGILLWMCYFPLALAPLAWIALVPLLTLVRLPISRGRVFWGAFLAGAMFFGPVLQWMRVADYRMYATWIMLAIYCSFYFPSGILLIRALDRRTRLPLMLSVPIVWTALEFIRSFLMEGFAWYFLGHSQHAILPLVQIADLTGVYGVSFLVAAVNGWLFECVWQIRGVRRFLRAGSVSDGPAAGRRVRFRLELIAQGACLLLALLATWIYGSWRLTQTDFEAGPRLALLQGNVDQRIRNEASVAENTEFRAQIMESYQDLCERASNHQPRPDLLIWPETAYPKAWLELHGDPGMLSEKGLAEIRERSSEIAALTQSLQTSQLLGVESYVVDETRKWKHYNSALLSPFGRAAAMDRYDKFHRVPFGEYVPLQDWLPFMKWFAPYDEGYGVDPGTKKTRFVLRAGSVSDDSQRMRPTGSLFHFGVIICFEDSDPFLARSYGTTAKEGPPVDFLVNISNDGWFEKTCEHEEHLALCRFRAIECRRAVARAVNMGISAVIDGNGRVLKPRTMPSGAGPKLWVIDDGSGPAAELPESEWPAFKNVGGVLIGRVPIDRRDSFYVRYGDWLPWGCCIAIVVGLLWRRLPSKVRLTL